MSLLHFQQDLASPFFCLLPALFDAVGSNSVPSSIMIVVSPLVALMKEKKSQFLPRGFMQRF